MKQSLKITLAPLWVPIIPSIVVGAICYITNAMELSVYSLNDNLSEPWVAAQVSVMSNTPDPLITAVVVYIFCIPVTYLLVGKALDEKARKEMAAEKGDLK